MDGNQPDFKYVRPVLDESGTDVAKYCGEVGSGRKIEDVILCLYLVTILSVTVKRWWGERRKYPGLGLYKRITSEVHWV